MPRAEKRDESPEEASARRLTEARSVTPELPEADLEAMGLPRPPGAVGVLRLRRSWGHAALVIDERGAQYKVFKPVAPPPAPAEKPKRGRKAAVEPPPGEAPADIQDVE